MLIDAFDLWTRDAGESDRKPCSGVTWRTSSSVQVDELTKEVNRKEEMQKEVSWEVRLTITIRSIQTETKEMTDLYVTYIKLPVVERALNICTHESLNRNSQKYWAIWTQYHSISEETWVHGVMQM